MIPGAEGAASGGRGYRLLATLAVVTFFLLAARLWYLQVLRGDHYYRKSADNFVKEIQLEAARGQVFDAHRRLLVDNRPAYNVYVTPRFVSADSLARLATFLKLDSDEAAHLRARVADVKETRRAQQMLAFPDITRNEMATLESHKAELAGVAVDARPHRFYPQGKLAAHTLGYMNQVGADELAKQRDQGYRLGDYVGRAGIERQWESYLRGKDGFERIFVDAKGRVKSDIDAFEIESFAMLHGEPRRQEPEPGNNVVLTLDMDLQRMVERALARHHSGAAAMIDVATGRVLALVSHPSFDPNVLTGRLTRAEDERLSKDPFRPLIDKALRENYYPGSTYKVVPALAALEDQLLAPEEKMNCKGAYELPGHTFHCMKSHGNMTQHSAMVESCNIFFYHLGERVGMDRMAKVAEDLGFGAPTGIGLGGEVAGFIPTQEYYRSHGGFRIGYTLNTAIGQGSTKVTVLQLALAYAAIANGGDLYVPLLVDRIEKPSGEVVQAFSARLRHRLAATPENLARVRSSLCGVVNEPKGTVFDFRDPDLPFEVCGKSGTAQVRKNRKGQVAGWDTGNDQAWFAAFAPAKEPKIAVVVLIEHGGLGGHVAAPVAMEIFRGYVAQQAKANGIGDGDGNGNGDGDGNGNGKTRPRAKAKLKVKAGR
ncbi:MAG: penicillin-binding protein 2 [Myxococcales bacterium]|nr:penicillin-binding protein 2 [Myxococcales bacterium]